MRALRVGKSGAFRAALLVVIASSSLAAACSSGSGSSGSPGNSGPKATPSEASVGLFSFLIVSLIVLTIIGIFFRGANMALIWPF